MRTYLYNLQVLTMTGEVCWIHACPKAEPYYRRESQFPKERERPHDTHDVLESGEAMMIELERTQLRAPRPLPHEVHLDGGFLPPAIHAARKPELLQ